MLSRVSLAQIYIGKDDHGFSRFCTGTAMGMGMGTRILTRQIPVPVAVPMTKELDSIIHSTDTPTIHVTCDIGHANFNHQPTQRPQQKLSA
jgi:hypothetical protein